jgi:hypothetical protein
MIGLSGRGDPVLHVQMIIVISKDEREAGG